MRAACEAEADKGGGLEATGISGCGAADAVIRSTRGLRGDWTAAAGPPNGRRADWQFWREQCFGSLARSGGPLTIVAARVAIVAVG